MGLLILCQVALDLGFIAMMTLLLIERSKAKTMEDPRLSKGLQLLTSKIAVMEDLMDRSETMGRQLSQIMDRKQQDIQERIEDVEIHLHKVNSAIAKSKEVAKIFQDRIPHQEIIERQNTAKYIKAAKMANQGLAIAEIEKQVDIPRGELDLIVKLNRNSLIVRDQPTWLETDSPKVQEEAFRIAPARPLASPEKSQPQIKPVIFRRISVLDDLG